jgi:hypothetical protein
MKAPYRIIPDIEKRLSAWNAWAQRQAREKNNRSPA